MSSFCTKAADCVIHEGDSPQVVRDKRSLCPVIFVLGFFSVFVYIQLILEGGGKIFYAAYGLFLVSCYGYVIGLFARVPFGLLMDVALLLFALGLFLSDLGAVAAGAQRPLLFFVVVLDVCLLYARDDIPRIIIPVLVVYIVVERAESTSRFGFYSFGKGSSVLCDCASPPCAESPGNAANGALVFALTFLIDFVLTRGFSSGLRQQLRTVNASVALAEEVAEALARYNVSGAELAIQRGADLPPKLVESYTQLLSNLRSYKAYLPDALLEVDDHESPVREVPPPGAGAVGDVEMGIVFTDIQSSTVLWEAHPQGMHEALRTHNTTLRAVANQNNGYEAKVIGDALMLAFAAAVDAVHF
eukprot:Hpha_TRINITY_DN4515_c0_g1::TRINITY_DN4515_c0_g1_i1::g.115563::m.115563